MLIIKKRVERTDRFNFLCIIIIKDVVFAIICLAERNYLSPRDAGLGEHDPCGQTVRGHVVVKCRSSASRETGAEILARTGRARPKPLQLQTDRLSLISDF